MSRSWVAGSAGSLFGIANLPFGVFSRAGQTHRQVGVAIGGSVLDVGALARAEGLEVADALAAPVLNPFLARGRQTWSAVRAWLIERLADERHRGAVELHLSPLGAVDLHLPFAVADYVDFYASEHHAANVGRMFRPDAEPLLPNWRHLPVGYHGRAGTVVVSGTPIRRPRGQRLPPGGSRPVYGPSERLDVEAEVGFVVGVPSALGEPLSVADFREHVFGVCLVNDWSARDVQAWESRPLGPFLGKSFATSVSPWVVPLAALEAARVPHPPHGVATLPYLVEEEPWGLDLALEIEWNGTVVSRPPFATMHWTGAQQLAHLTANGASVRTGDLYASGTVSGPERGQRGSFLELSWGGTEPITLADGSERSFLADGDTVVISGSAPGPGDSRVGLGAVGGTIVDPT